MDVTPHEIQTINLKKLFSVLKSKDLSLLEKDDVKWMFDGKTRYLDQE
jgi:hypothetical protein